jgi:hypothetical protein
LEMISYKVLMSSTILLTNISSMIALRTVLIGGNEDEWI